MSNNPISLQNPGYTQYWTTGSNVTNIPLCLEPGVQATNSYGVPTYTYGGPCIFCKSSIQIVLDFNSVDAHYYARCPMCNRVYRWLNPDGTASDFQQVIVTVNNALIKEYDEVEPNNGWF